MANLGDRIRDAAELIAVIGGAIAAVAKVADIAKDVHDRSKPPDDKRNEAADAA
jgi:hypothetical protein